MGTIILLEVGTGFHPGGKQTCFMRNYPPEEPPIGTDGKVKRKVWFDMLDNKQSLDLAIKDLKDNYELYIERYIKWLKK